MLGPVTTTWQLPAPTRGIRRHRRIEEAMSPAGSSGCEDAQEYDPVLGMIRPLNLLHVPDAAIVSK